MLFIQSENYNPKSYADYFYQNAMLKIVTSLLTKKYQNNDDHILATKQFLKFVTRMVSKLLHLNFVSSLILCCFELNICVFLINRTLQEF